MYYCANACPIIHRTATSIRAPQRKQACAAREFRVKGLLRGSESATGGQTGKNEAVA